MASTNIYTDCQVPSVLPFFSEKYMLHTKLDSSSSKISTGNKNHVGGVYVLSKLNVKKHILLYSENKLWVEIIDNRIKSTEFHVIA